MKTYIIEIEVERGMKMSEIEDIIGDVLNPVMTGTYNVEWKGDAHNVVVVTIESEDDVFKPSDIEDELGELLSKSGFECYYKFIK